MKRYDYLVIGAGSAGAAFAARKVEKHHSVALLEAGPNYTTAQMPTVWRSPNPLRGLQHPESFEDLVWEDVVSTRTDAQAPSLYWRGRGVGGSSAVNGQIAIRPPLEEFDSWVAEGCKDWGPAEVLPYFNKLESDNDYGDHDYHGADGPVPIFREQKKHWGSVDRALYDSARALGFPEADDINAPGATGVSRYPINSRDYERVSTNDAYLEPLRQNSKLNIYGDCTVDRIIFDGQRAIGVECFILGEHTKLFAENIVVSAGVIHSPAILMRSGIGPAATLANLSIECRSDLPVGESMQDHPLISLGLALKPECSISSPDDRHTNVAARYTSSTPARTFNDMFLIAMNQNIVSMNIADTSIGAGGIGVWVNQCFSRGNVMMRSADPFEQPYIRQNMLGDPRDRAKMRDGIRILGDIATSSHVRDICAYSPETVNKELFAALDDDDAALDTFMMNFASDTQHGTSTCRMGDPSSPTSVVDSDGHVLGVEGLRVVDASIFPSVSLANTNLTAIMVGEFMADRP
jgi:choline dehydrogenase-like flavoprotein